MWKASWNSGGGGGGWYPTAQNVTSGRALTLAFGFLMCSLENIFFQYNEIISTSKLPFHNPLVVKYHNVFSIFFFRLWKLSFTKFSWYIILHIYCMFAIHINYMALDNVYFTHGWIAPGKYIVIKVEFGLQLHFKIFFYKSDRKKNNNKNNN